MEIDYQIMSKHLANSFLTATEFNELLLQYVKFAELESVFFKVHSTKWIQSNYGQKIPRESEHHFTVDTRDPSIQIDCYIWSKNAVEPQINENLSEIICSYLHLPCTSGCLLPSYQAANMDKKCDATLHRFLERKKSVAVFMIDLDHFKEVNDKYGHEVGSGVITQFAALLQKECKENAITIHRSGDEFFILMPYDDTSAPLDLAYRIAKAAKSYPFKDADGTKVVEVELTASQGICLCEDKNITFKFAADEAEKAYHPKGKNQGKFRDSVRIVYPNASKSSRGEENREKAFTIVKTHLGLKNLFLNPFLDFLSFLSSSIKEDGNFQEVIDDAISWLSPKEETGMLLLGKSGNSNYQCEWSQDELAFALLHGLARNPIMGRGKKLNLFFHEEPGFSISIDNTSLYQYGKTLDDRMDYEHFYFQLPDQEISQYELRTVILVQIGYQPLPIPESCFYRVIRIDDRATIGGNLPDFWEATLSELIDQLSAKTFLQHVLVVGKKEHGETFCDVLENRAQWGEAKYPYSFLAKKIRQPIEHIQMCQKSIENAVQFIDNDAELISTMKTICQCDKWHLRSSDVILSNQHRFLNRCLNYENIRLGIADGCIVDTMEEAFPTTLEILRQSPTNQNSSDTQDQAGRKLKELSNFKIIIKRPNSKYVPEYYEEDQDKLENYYQSVFGSKDGFFQKHLQANGQYDAVLKHIMQLISENGLQYATRRAILVVPHIIDNPNDLTPLGLISIYIAPRKSKEGIVFDFSFTWRTVEAVVGFPYSLYSSIRYAEHILETIRKEYNKSHGDIDQLKMGSVSYLAYSLHMFLDEPYLQIVRGIINDATQ